METNQKDIEEKDPFGQNRRADDDDDDHDGKSFLKAQLAERALKNDIVKMSPDILRHLKKAEEIVLAKKL